MSDDKVKIRPWVKPNISKPEKSFIGIKVTIPWETAGVWLGKVFRRKKKNDNKDNGTPPGPIT